MKINLLIRNKVNIEKEERVEYIKRLVETLPPSNQNLLHWYNHSFILYILY